MRPERAWFLQARSDLESARLLEAQGGDTRQIIMHLQMCSEKLIKGYMRRAGPVIFTHRTVHDHFTYLSSVIVGDVNLRNGLMGRSTTRAEVNRTLHGLERTMRKVEMLNPSVAPRNGPNCEYPWETLAPHAVGHSPVTHKFGNAVGIAARAKLLRMLDRILSIEGA